MRPNCHTLWAGFDLSNVENAANAPFCAPPYLASLAICLVSRDTFRLAML